MKLLVFLLVLSVAVYFAAAQPGTINRLTYKLNRVASDTGKAATLDSIAMYYLFFTDKPDSSFYYINELINHAFNLKDKKFLILGYARLGFYYLNTSQYKPCLDISFKGINLSEEYHIPDYLSALHYNVSWVYDNMGDGSSALKSAFEGLHYLGTSKDAFMDQQLHLLGLIGNIYLDNQKYDSAYYYFKKVDALSYSSTELAAKDISNWYQGMYYLFTKNYSRADSIFAVGIRSCEKNGDFLLNVFNLFLAQSYFGQGKIHEALSAARRAMAISESLDDQGDARSSASLLYHCYTTTGNNDSAFHYLKIADSLGALVNSKGDASQVQQIRFDRQLSAKEKQEQELLQNEKNRGKIRTYVFLTALVFFLVIVGIQWRTNNQKKKSNAILQQQKEKTESTLTELKSTQSQLIQSAKMASLGELTAGIAHEIQNPLNFVNNFSDVNAELIEEAGQEIRNGNISEAELILSDIKENEAKINHHGKRADSIVKGMLLHSRTSTGQKELTDINALADEYLRLSYHGIRAKDKNFNAGIRTDFDETIRKINIIPQDIGSVLLNLYNNAFYAVNEKNKLSQNNFEPTVLVSTKKNDDKILIYVKDNGNGIPQKIIDKIFQPFFTTKPTGQGTGLGLSLSYDIVKAHGGEIKLNTKEREGTEFIIQLPIV